MSATRTWFTGILLLVAAVLFAQDAPPAAPPAGNDRFLAFASVDKPIYRTGENVFIRTVILGANDHKPLPADANAYASYQITGPRGEILANGNAAVQDSVAAFAWNVPAQSAGGQYTATISFPAMGFPPAVRKFEVRAYRAPRLKGEIVFLRDGFGPGDTVKASLHVERAEGGLPAGAAVNANAIVDGAEIFTGKTTVDPAGNCAVEFKLPSNIQRGQGTLSLAVTDGGVVEPIAKTIPILVKTLDLAIYPEGGDLVAGVPCRVYIESRTPAKKPADIVGVIVDSKGTMAAEVRTEHEGRGRFSFTPAAGQTYAIKIVQPTGIDQTFPLPAVKPAGVSLTSTHDVFAKGQPVELVLTSTSEDSFTVSLSKHDALVASQSLKLEAGKPTPVKLTAPAWADGVLVATVKDSTGKPVAERLIFRQPTHGLHVTVTPDQSSYIPAAPVSLTVTTTDDDGKPVGATVGITVTDDSVLRMMEKRDRAPDLCAMVFLENDVRELADAQIYLDAKDPKAPLATDLLLGTQGWRRFATADEAKFLAANGDAGRRALADRQPPPQPEPPMMFGAARNGAGGGMMLQREKDRELDRAVNHAEATAMAPAAPQLAARAPAPVDALPADAVAADINPLPAGKQGQLRRLAPMRPFIPQPIVRIYAHDLRPGRQAGERSDFTETLYWAAAVKTDPGIGVAKVVFKLNDSVTSFKAMADAFDQTGALGGGSAIIQSVQPFYIEPKLPLEVSAGDVIRLPIAAVNGTGGALPVKLTITAGPGIGVMPVDPFTLAAGARQRSIVQVRMGARPLDSDFVIHADAGNFSDDVTRRIAVKPLGFPVEITHGGLIAANGKASFTLEIPQTVAEGSVQTMVALYPNPLGSLTDALARLLQEPYGCFEQTTSTTYPLVMADQYFLTHSGVDPALIARSGELLANGYNRLLGFECKNKGYEWFGEDPGHECLSAYGLLEFTDMSAVRQVDADMLANTRNWLLARRDGTGGFTHERRALHTWVTDPDCANGYSTWALLECGQTGLDKEVSWLKEHAAGDDNSYVKALAANALFLAGDHDGAKTFMTQLAQRQDADGHVNGATTTVVGSGGESLQIETASLATLAWLRDPAFAANVEKAIHFLADSCQAGRYGSTQSTVLALRAIVTYDKARAHPAAPGKIQLFVDDKAAGNILAFDSNTNGAVKLPDFSDRMTPGKHTLELRMSDGSTLPFAMAVTFSGVVPASSDQCKVAITTKLAAAQVDEGAATQVDVAVSNLTAETLPTPIAIVGLPGGLEVRHDQLKELVKAGQIAAYEVRGREVILYRRDLQPRQVVNIPLSVLAAVPGEYTGPASRAYLYYTDEFKQWQEGLKVKIVPK